MFNGEKIRQLRVEKDYSLQTLAEKAGVSVSIISKIERNIVDPSVTVLYKICNGLDVTVTGLLGETIDKLKILRKEERQTVLFPKSHSRYELLTPAYDGSLEMIMIYLEPGQSDKTLVSHKGEECGVVLQGEMTVILDEEEYVLYQGDSICFNSQTPHRFYNHTSEQSISVWTMKKK